MKTVVIAILMAMFASFCAAAKHKGGIGSQTDFKNMPPEQALAFLQDAGSITIDAKGEWQNACNGKKSDGEPGEQECMRSLTQFEQDYNSAANLLQLFKGLFRACGVYAVTPGETWGDNRSGASCGLLGSLFFAIGNVPTAKSIWEHAPGCHSQDINGNPTNGCMRFILTGGPSLGVNITFLQVPGRYQLYASDKAALIPMAQQACSKEIDVPSCKFLRSQGTQIDLRAVSREQSIRADDELAARKEQQDARNDKARESDARFNTVMGALQSVPGANDPNAVLTAGSQQAAAIRAIGNANPAGTGPYIPQPQTAVAPQAARTDSSGGTGNHSTLEQSGSGPGVSGTSGASEGTGSSNGNGAVYANPLPSSCVSTFWDPKHYNWLSFQNNCGQAIYLSYIFSSGQYGFSAMNLAPGASGNTGQSQDEVNEQGGYKLAVCPAGFVPIDPSTGNALSQPNQNCSCKKQ